jgi:hypothetical protein
MENTFSAVDLEKTLHGIVSYLSSVGVASGTDICSFIDKDLGKSALQKGIDEGKLIPLYRKGVNQEEATLDQTYYILKNRV